MYTISELLHTCTFYMCRCTGTTFFRLFNIVIPQFISAAVITSSPYLEYHNTTNKTV